MSANKLRISSCCLVWKPCYSLVKFWLQVEQLITSIVIKTRHLHTYPLIVANLSGVSERIFRRYWIMHCQVIGILDPTVVLSVLFPSVRELRRDPTLDRIPNILFGTDDDCKCENDCTCVVIIKFVDEIVVNSRMESFENRCQVIKQHTWR